MSVPRQAIVLCAGEGRRLRPLTARRPKPLLPLLNVPLVQHALVALARAGVERVALNAWHLAPQLVAFAATDPVPGLRLHVRVEPRLLGTGGGIANLRDWLAREPLLVLAGDIVADFDLAAFAAHHAASGAEASMALTARADPSRFGAVSVGAGGLLHDIAGLLGRDGGRGVGAGRTFVNASAHLLEPDFVDRLTAGPSCLVRQGYIPTMAAGGRCGGWEHAGPWAELGGVDALLAAQRDALAGALPVDAGLVERGGRRDGRHSLVHATARVAAGVVLSGGTVVGAGAEVGSAARLAGCLVLPGALVAAGARLENVVVDAPDAAPAAVPGTAPATAAPAAAAARSATARREEPA